MKSEARLQLFHAFARQNEVVRSLCRAQVFGVKSSVRIGALANPHLHVRARRALYPDALDPGQVLPEIVEVNAGLLHRHALRHQHAVDANGLEILGLDDEWLRVDRGGMRPAGFIEASRIPTRLRPPRIASLSVVNFGFENI